MLILWNHNFCFHMEKNCVKIGHEGVVFAIRKTGEDV